MTPEQLIEENKVIVYDGVWMVSEGVADTAVELAREESYHRIQQLESTMVEIERLLKKITDEI